MLVSSKSVSLSLSDPSFSSAVSVCSHQDGHQARRATFQFLSLTVCSQIWDGLEMIRINMSCVKISYEVSDFEIMFQSIFNNFDTKKKKKRHTLTFNWCAIIYWSDTYGASKVTW